jgi:hypothetical protein
MAVALAEEGMTMTHVIGPQTGHRYHPAAKEEINRHLGPGTKDRGRKQNWGGQATFDMIPIHELLNRIRWDSELAKGNFELGYYDLAVACTLFLSAVGSISYAAPPTWRAGYTCFSFWTTTKKGATLRTLFSFNICGSGAWTRATAPRPQIEL